MKSYWYTDTPNSLYGNVGDMLTPLIIEHFTGKKPEYAKADESGKLLAVGSIAEFIQPSDVVWGSGLIEPMKIEKRENVKILAVRGKKTAEILRKAGYDVPEIYGDPAVLMPDIYDPWYDDDKILLPRRDVGYVPHYVEWDAFKRYAPEGYFINVINYPKVFIREICECKNIITSSLHAYILAQAYGIQAEYLQLTSKIIGGYFKYEDYISGRGDSEALKKVFIDWYKTVS